MTSSFTCMTLAALLASAATAPRTASPSALAAAAERRRWPSWDERSASSPRAGPSAWSTWAAGRSPAWPASRRSSCWSSPPGEVVGYCDSSLGFRHGPKAVLTTRTLVVVVPVQRPLHPPLRPGHRSTSCAQRPRRRQRHRRSRPTARARRPADAGRARRLPELDDRWLAGCCRRSLGPAVRPAHLAGARAHPGQPVPRPARSTAWCRASRAPPRPEPRVTGAAPSWGWTAAAPKRRLASSTGDGRAGRVPAGAQRLLLRPRASTWSARC